MTTLETARLIVDAIAGKLGSDILLLDISQVTLLADYFVIATGDTAPQLDAIAEDVRQQVKQQDGRDPYSTEGSAESGWVLLDYGGIVVHLFSPAQRRRYQLEELWSSGRTIVRIA